MARTKRDNLEALKALVKKNIDADAIREPIKVSDDEPAFLKGLFAQQRAFIDHPSRRKALLGSRQCGKSFLACTYLAKVALGKARGSCLYLGLSRQKAKELIWDDLQDYNERWSLGFEFNEAELCATHPRTKSKIYLRGCDSKREKEKVRGGRYDLIIVDEAQLLGAQLSQFVNAVLTAATLAKQGTIALLGTPDVKPFGLFYEITHLDDISKPILGWQVFKWTIRDNPHIPNVEVQLQEILTNNNWEPTNPHFTREYLGKWVTSHDLLAYKFDYERNTIAPQDLPSDLGYTVAIDFGNNDPTAIVVIGSRKDDRNFYVVDAWLKEGQTPSDVAPVIEHYRNKYHAHTLVGDAGGIGKAYVEEYRKLFALPIKAADKQKKRGLSFEFVNDDLLTGRVKVVRQDGHEGLDKLIEEFCSLQWKDPLNYELEYSAQDHLTDAFRYGHGSLVRYTDRKKKVQVSVNPLQQEQQAVENYWQGIIDQEKSQRQKQWWQIRNP